MTDGEYPITGRCTCGAVEYEMRCEPIYVHCCHCTWCQREIGSAFAVNALIETSNVRLTSGNVEKIETPSNSGTGQEIVRCPSCEVALWSHYGAAKQKIAFVRVGTLDNSNACPPDMHIYTSTKLSWVKLDDSVPKMAEYYRRSEFWSDHSVARYKNAIDA